MEDQEMPLVEHLEELRRRLIVSILVILALGFVFAILIIPSEIVSSDSFGFRQIVLDILTGPLPAGQSPLAVLAPTEAFLVFLKIAFLLAVLVSLPIVLYEVWAFVGVALRPAERKWIYTYLPISFFFFAAGSLFAYYIVLPHGLSFLLGLASDFNQAISFSKYTSFFALMLLAFGIVFQLPVVAMFLSSIGLVDHRFLARKRPYALVGAFIVAAVLTPPDVFTQSMMAVPLMFLYEISIVASWIITRRRIKMKERAAAEAG
jgi:sec-independent protein translocase protein TatC